MARKMIGLPWRAFKAYHQRYCIDTMTKQQVKDNQYVSLFDSTAKEAQKHVATMIDAGLLYRIELNQKQYPVFDSPSEEVRYIDDLINNHPEELQPYLERNDYLGSKSLMRAHNTASYGYETEDTEIIVYPKKSSDKGRAWMASRGHCVFCGCELTLFKRDALSMMPPPFTGKYLACKSCHSTKTGHTLEEMRILMAMRVFEATTGLRFTLDQLRFLEKIQDIKPIDLMIEHYEFYFEAIQMPVQQQEQEHEKVA